MLLRHWTERFCRSLRWPLGGKKRSGLQSPRRGGVELLEVGALLTPLLSINDASVTEGHSGTTTMTFTVTLSEPAPHDFSCYYDTTDETATQATDYFGVGMGELVLSAGHPTCVMALRNRGLPRTFWGRAVLYESQVSSNPHHPQIGDQSSPKVQK